MSTEEQVINDYFLYVAHYIYTKSGSYPCKCGIESFVFDVSPARVANISEWQYGFPKPSIGDLRAFTQLDVYASRDKAKADDSDKVKLFKTFGSIIGTKIGTPITLTSTDLIPLLQYLENFNL